MFRNKNEIKPILENDVINQHCQDLKTVMNKKQLFLIPNLSLIDLSNETGIPVYEVKKALNKGMQLTFFEFISIYKINKAKDLLTNLRENQFSISTISVQSGFNTQESFVTIFKKYTKMLPEEYRIKYFSIEPESSSSYEI